MSSKNQPREVHPATCDVAEHIKTFPPAVALAAQSFLNDGFVVTAVYRKHAKEGMIRFRKVGSVQIKQDGREWSEHTVIRAQLSW